MTSSLQRTPTSVFMDAELSCATTGVETRGDATNRLQVNYRTTAQNLSHATSILEGAEWIDSETENDTLAGYRSLANGLAPVIAHTADKHEELEIVAATVKQWLDSDSPSMHVGILTRTNRQANEMKTFLGEKEIAVSGDRSGAATLKNQVSVTTKHNAKGMEFTNVILSDVSTSNMPKVYGFNALAESEQHDALQRERALLYVAASRARDQLMITMIGELSELLPQMFHSPLTCRVLPFTMELCPIMGIFAEPSRFNHPVVSIIRGALPDTTTCDDS